MKSDLKSAPMLRLTDVFLDPTASTEICKGNTEPLDNTMFLSVSLIFD